MHLAEKIRKLRAAKGLTQQQLADKVGIYQDSIGYYEQGRAQPPWDVLYKIADALGVSTEEFRECVKFFGQPLPKRARHKPGRPRKEQA